MFVVFFKKWALLRDVPLQEVCTVATQVSLCTFSKFYKDNFALSTEAVQWSSLNTFPVSSSGYCAIHYSETENNHVVPRKVYCWSMVFIANALSYCQFISFFEDLGMCAENEDGSIVNPMLIETVTYVTSISHRFFFVLLEGGCNELQDRRSK